MTDREPTRDEADRIIDTQAETAQFNPMMRGEEDMRGTVLVHGIEEAARMVADTYAPPFNLDAHARLQGIVREAFAQGALWQLNRTPAERVF